MNKNQKQIRRLAAQNHGETFNVCKAYDQTVPNSRFTHRNIPQSRQPRLSTKAKVAAKHSKEENN